MATYERLEADAYMTPKWCVESLLNTWKPRYKYVLEPACGTGNISSVLREYNFLVNEIDIKDYGRETQILDFLTITMPEPSFPISIVTNPPYTLIGEFIERALFLTAPHEGSIAFLLRHEWDAPKSHRKYLQWPFSQKLLLPKRPLWIDGPVKASPRHPYAWYIWDYQHEGPPTIGFLD